MANKLEIGANIGAFLWNAFEQSIAGDEALAGNLGLASAYSHALLGTPHEYEGMNIQDIMARAGDVIESGDYGGFAGRMMEQEAAGGEKLRGMYGEGAEELRGMFGDISGQLMGSTENMRSRIMGDYTGLQEGLLQSQMEEGQALRDYAKGRYEKGMGLLEGMGEQEKKDIEQAFASRGAEIGQDLRSRGMGGTTIGSTLQTGNIREQTGALGRLKERLRGQTLQTHAGLSGDVLKTKGMTSEALQGLRTQLGVGRLGMDVGLSGGEQDLLRSLAEGGFNLESGLWSGEMGLESSLLSGGQQMEMGLGTNVLNFMGSPNINYPDEGSYLQGQYQSGWGTVDPWTPPSPGWGQQALPWVQTGLMALPFFGGWGGSGGGGGGGGGGAGHGYYDR